MSRNIALLLVFVLTVSSIVSVLPVKAEARTIVVPVDFGTIQAAINAANEGDTIFVKKGTYQEKQLIISKTISLTGEDLNHTTINLDPPLVEKQILTYIHWDWDVAIKINAEVAISNLTIAALGNIISVNGTKIKITGNNLRTTNSYIGIIGDGDEIQVIGNLIASSGLQIQGSNQTIAQNTIPQGSIYCSGRYNKIIGNNFSNSSDNQIDVVDSFNLIYGNTITQSQGFGVKIRAEAASNIIAKNSIDGGAGVSVERGNDNLIVANKISNCYVGIEVMWGSNNTFYANYIENTIEAARLGYDESKIGRSKKGPAAYNNSVYHNNFINNTQQAIDWNWLSTNYWDYGGEGNYWSDYGGADWNFDGIGDSPYFLSEAISHYAESHQGKDRYPLMAPFNISYVSVELPDWAADVSEIIKDLPHFDLPEHPTPFPTAWIIIVTGLVGATVIVLVLAYVVKVKKSRLSKLE